MWSIDACLYPYYFTFPLVFLLNFLSFILSLQVFFFFSLSTSCLFPFLLFMATTFISFAIVGFTLFVPQPFLAL